MASREPSLGETLVQRQLVHLQDISPHLMSETMEISFQVGHKSWDSLPMTIKSKVAMMYCSCQ